jgi:hypothetical protein
MNAAINNELVFRIRSSFINAAGAADSAPGTNRLQSGTANR